MSRSDILQGFGERLIAGIQRRAVVMPTRWAQEYVRTPDNKPTSFKRFPWQREMLDSKAPYNLAKKGAQLGVSHVALIRGLCANDMEKRDVLYVLPSMTPTGSDFSSARFDALVQASPHLTEIYDKSNVGHKRTSTNSFYIRGAQSKAGGKSVPVGFLVVDEIDEVPKWFITLVYERLSGQDEKLIWAISTPTIPEHGISKLWDESSQESFFFPCPHHSVSGSGPTEGGWIQLTYPDCLEVVGDDPDSTRVLKESYLKCPTCRHKLDHGAKVDFLAAARFVPMVSDKEKRGFHVNQLYSTTVTPGEVAAASIRAKFSEIDAQEFNNSKLAIAYTPAGSRVTDAWIESCKSTHLNYDAPYHTDKVRTMGVDVGSWIHYEIDEWAVGDSYGNDVNSYSIPKVVRTGRVRNFDELDAFMRDYRINMCVVDAMPDTRTSFAFSQRWWGLVKMCYFAQGVTGKMLVETKWDQGEPIINVNRTSWLDQALGRFKPGNYGSRAGIILPMDLPYEYVEHVKTPVRIHVRDQHGNPVAKYVGPDGKADHHAFARCYAEMALPLAASGFAGREIDSPL